MYLEQTDIYQAMDPKLQRVLDRRQRGLRTLATGSSSADEIGVIALVSDRDAWRDLSEVREGAELAQLDGGDWLVTGRIPMSRIEIVRRTQGLKSLKAAQPLWPCLKATVEDIKAAPSALPPAQRSSGGAGVIIGIIDSGADFAHQNFQNSDGSTRIAALWDQNGALSPDSPFGYGQRYDSGEINAALKARNPYAALGYGPAPDTLFDHGAHGTHVMDIACGNGRGSGVSGVAPEADIVFVDLAASDIAWVGEEVVGSEFGDSIQMLEALRFIFNEAGDQPCVVNISLGTNGGPHDGSSWVEITIDAMVQEKPGRAVVIAASNSFADDIHATGDVRQGDSADLRWVIPTNAVSQSELEVWYSGEDRFSVELIAPDGTSIGPIPSDSNTRVRGNDGKVLFLVSNRLNDPSNGDNVIGVFVDEKVPGGEWTIRLHGDQVSDGNFHAWIERNDPSQSSFATLNNNTNTLGSISCGQLSIAVGSYDAHKQGRPISFFSSAGPTRDGREKPEISAPGHAVLAAHSRTKTGVTRKSGTSMAAPAVTGAIALLLAEATARRIRLSASDIRNILSRTSQHNPPPGRAWDDRFGSGRVDVAAALAEFP